MLYVVGEEHSLGYMERAVMKLWGDTSNPRLHQYDKGFFIVTFRSAEVCEMVLKGGPYNVKGKPIVQKQ